MFVAFVHLKPLGSLQLYHYILSVRLILVSVRLFMLNYSPVSLFITTKENNNIIYQHKLVN